MTDVERLVASMIQFLGEQIRSDSLSVDTKESIEVAIQCLESAYSVSSSDAHLLPSRGLMEIFTDAIKNEPSARESTPSEEAKQEAEDLKSEGNNLMKMEKYEDALKCYTKAIKIDSKNAVLYCNRAAAYSKLNNHSFALEDCHRAIDIDPTYSKAYGRMGLAYASLNDHYRAKECYQKAVDLDPSNESYRNNLTVADEAIANAQRQDPFAAMSGPGGFDIGSIISNPAMMNMASQIMQDPNMQNIVGGLLTGMRPPGGAPAPTTEPGTENEQPSANPTQPPAGGPGIEAFLQMGQQLAAQMQSQNPDFVEQLRRQMGPRDRPDDENPGSGSV